MSDPNDDPASAWRHALDKAHEMLAKLDSGALADLQHELLDKWVAVYCKELDGKIDEYIVPKVVETFRYFKVGGNNKVSKKTVYNALRAMKEKREAEEAHAKKVVDSLTTTKT